MLRSFDRRCRAVVSACDGPGPAGLAAARGASLWRTEDRLLRSFERGSDIHVSALLVLVSLSRHDSTLTTREQPIAELVAERNTRGPSPREPGGKRQTREPGHASRGIFHGP